MNIDSVLPTSQHVLTQSRLHSIDFSFEQILKIIRSLDVKKAHGHDDISIRMIKNCDNSLVRPLSVLLKKSFDNSYFPELWKKIKYYTSPQKKNDKYNFENYRSILLLLIFSKIFEKTMFNKMYAFLQNEQLLNPNQSGFRPSSYINQSTSVTHGISQSFDATPPLEVRSVFLDISKAFDKIWREGLLYKLNSILWKLYKLMGSYLSNEFQRVVLNRQTSSWWPILAGVPQRSILGPLLFLIYVNDMSDDLKSSVKLFPDDTFIFIIVKNKNNSAKGLTTTFH